MLIRYVFDLGIVEPWSMGRLVNFLTNHPASEAPTDGPAHP
jgi:hypothetical protein